MPDTDYIKGLKAADQAVCKMREDQKSRPNAPMICGWLHVEICGLIAAAQQEAAPRAE